jgi:type II secretory pathway pseudopilin PulG
MVEMLVVILVMGVLACGVVLPFTGRHRECARRSSCGNNLGNIIKCCHLYSDASPQLGSFPNVDGPQNYGGQQAMAKLYNAYVKDHRVYACPQKSNNTAILKPYVAPDESTLQSGYTNYGYDPGHTPVHATAGVVSDYGTLHATNHKNSTNHGNDGPGQNVAIGAGSVEWWDDADHRATKDVNDRPITDDIFADDIALPNFIEELETNIIP